MIKLLKWLQGYVIFEATGGFVERFLNLCKINSINLWSVKNDGVKVEAFTTSGEISKLSIPAQRSGMDVKIVKKCGLPFFLKAHKWRCGAFLGVLLMSLVLWLLSCFIWNVEIVSTTGVKIEGFTEKVEEMGVEIGARKSKIDILQFQEELLNSFSELSWVSLNIFGTKAQIEYTCGKPQLPVTDTKSPTNVVAGKSGEVIRVEGYLGENKVKHGQNVTKGSLLISGVVKNADMSETLVHAKGKVFARTQNEISKELSFLQNPKITQNWDSFFEFRFFGFSIPLGKLEFDDIKSVSPMLLEGNGTILPIGVNRTDAIFLSEQSVTHTAEECALWCLLKCVVDKRSEYGEAELENVEYSLTQATDKAAVVTRIECVENIAVECPMSVE